MADERSILVIANVTAASRELVDALKDLAAAKPCHFTLVVPPKPNGHEEHARERLAEALMRMRNAGLDVDGTVGDPDPVRAAMAADGVPNADIIAIRSVDLDDPFPRPVAVYRCPHCDQEHECRFSRHQPTAPTPCTGWAAWVVTPRR
ncbi:hypothetical protein [Mycobacterium sp.]|uniref:hypothetical protein n=1 Tax=Mycobacterium sp. TaxID=1785 RepID=UPI003F964986